MTAPPPPSALHVTIVAENRETLDGLEEYLRAAGVTARGNRSINLDSVAGSCAAVVLFPDEFETAAVDAALLDLRLRHPNVLPVVVTNQPKRFEEAPHPGAALSRVVIGKPAWGWTILDAIRSRIATD